MTWVLVGAGAALGVLLLLYVRANAAERRTRGHLDLLMARTQEVEAGAASARADAGALRAALAAMPDPVLIADGAGRIVSANPALEGLAGARVTGRLLDEAFPASELGLAHSAALAGEPVAEQIVLRRPQGPRTWEVQARKVDDPGAAATVMTFRDVTEPARAVQVRTDFVANASHELRTPIAAIRMALDTLSAVGDTPGPTRDRLLEVMTTQVGRLEELVQDLLDLSRLESEAEVRIEPVRLAELEPALRARFEPVCRERRLTLEFAAPADLAIHADRRLLELILGNLIDNAAKFAFEGTSVRVSAAVRSPQVVHIDVTDRGAGIPLDQQQRIFERFYQVDPSRAGPRRGSGLGLAIVKHAVRRLGGAIRVQSVWQQGTTMSVELPGAPVHAA